MAIPYLYPTTFPYGSRVVTFNFGGGGTGAAILESFDSSEPTTEISRQDQLGAPNGFALIAEPRTATATAQLATSASTYVTRGDTSSFAPPGSATAITWVVTQTSNPEGNREVKKQSLTLREVI